MFLWYYILVMKKLTNTILVFSILLGLFVGVSVKADMVIDGRSIKEVYNQDLKYGSTGAEVQQLQHFLNTHKYPVAISGPGSKGHETSFYGPATTAAVLRMQKENAKVILGSTDVALATGSFDLATRKFVNILLSVGL
jgi:hypothetical protein